jgi:hypothetical protein
MATFASICAARTNNGESIGCCTMNDRAERIRSHAWIGLCLVGLLFAWIASRVITLGMAEHLSRINPGASLTWRAEYPEALLRRFGPQGDAKVDSALQVAAAKAGVRASPLDGRGYRLLAQQAERDHDLASAEKLYGLAATRGPRDLQSLGWLTTHALAHGDYSSAFAKIDQMLRVQPELMPQLSKVLIALLDKAPVQVELANLLQKDPPWRSDFLTRSMNFSKNSSALFALVERLRLSPEGLSEVELSKWLDRLGNDRQWGAAYLIWAQSLPSEARQHIGNVYNGSFELEPSDSGFDWRFTDIPGAIISRTQTTGASGIMALRVDFEDRRVPFKNVRQLLALSPGRYQLQGRVRLDDLRSERGLVWTLTCAEDGRVFAETEPMSGHRAWSGFSLDLAVPADSCSGQWLTLRIPARIPAEQLIGGTAWFDNLQIQAVSQ